MIYENKGKAREALKLAEEIDAYSIHPGSRVLDKKIIEEAHKKGIKVLVWNIDRKREVDRLRKLGVDGVFSNRPNRFI